MELTFFGTSSGVPTRDRNVSAIALAESMGSSWYLIDCGEGTQHQILKSPYSLMTIEAIFITHTHGDHCFGLPGLLASAGMSGRKNALKIVAPSGIKEWLNTTQEVSETYIPFEIEYYSPTNLADFQMGEFKVSTIKLSHRVDSYAYVFTEASTDPILDTDKLKAKNIPRGPLWGEIQSGKEIVHQGTTYSSGEFLSGSRKPRKIIICGDNDKPELVDAEILGCDVWVHESTYTEDFAERARQVGHSYASLVAAFAEKRKVPNLILTHFSARYQFKDGVDTIQDLRAEAKNHYSGNLYLASDLDRYKLDKSGRLSKVESYS